jgi:hypothetical protein
MFSKILILFVFFVILSIFYLNWLNEIHLIKKVSLKEDEMCTTQWYKEYHLEFDVFSTQNFSKVIFLMDQIYSNIIQDGLYQCLFFKYG